MGELFQIFVNVIAPVFLLVLLGYFVGPRLSLDGRTLSRTAYFVLTPCFVFSRLVEVQIEFGLVVRMMLYMGTITLSCALLGLITARLLRRSKKMTAAYINIAVFGNVGNFGFPIIQFAFSEEALGAATIYFLVVMILSFIIGVAAASWQQGGGAGAVVDVLRTPALIVVPIAVLFNWYQLELPLTLDRPVDLLADALVPTMLLTLGVQLASARIPRPDLDMFTAGAIRLLGGPLIAIALTVPFGMTGLEQDVGILQASMPVAVLVSIIANEYDMLPAFVTTTVMVTTLASVITITTLIALL